MAFVPLFCDSFDHYATAQISEKWPGASPSVAITSATSRTGTSSMEFVQDAVAGGVITPNIGKQSNLLVGTAYNPAVASIGTIMNFLDQAGNDYQCFVSLNADGSLSVRNHYIGQPGPTLLTTPTGLMRVGIWNTIAIGIIFSAAGSVWIWVNGILVASVTGVNTIHSGNNWCDGVQLSGPASDLDTSANFDDFYVGYSTTPLLMPNDYPGALRIYPYIPAANETPLQWTPLSGANWQETSQIPPPGDSAYVTSSTPGDIDQYEMQPISGEGPAGVFSIAFGQTVISARIDTAGAGSVAPNIGGTEGTASALTTSYSMYTECFALNPVTGQPFEPGDFTTTTFMGPEVVT